MEKKPVEERLSHALVKGISDYAEEDAEEARQLLGDLWKLSRDL